MIFSPSEFIISIKFKDLEFLKSKVMKKLVLLSVSVVFALSSMHAQVVPVSPFAEGVKLLNYEKNKSALAFFKSSFSSSGTISTLNTFRACCFMQAL